MTCIFEQCKNCKEYSNCPLMSAVLQRNYANRKLDEILKLLERLEEKLESR